MTYLNYKYVGFWHMTHLFKIMKNVYSPKAPLETVLKNIKVPSLTMPFLFYDIILFWQKIHELDEKLIVFLFKPFCYQQLRILNFSSTLEVLQLSILFIVG